MSAFPDEVSNEDTQDMSRSDTPDAAECIYNGHHETIPNQILLVEVVWDFELIATEFRRQDQSFFFSEVCTIEFTTGKLQP